MKKIGVIGIGNPFRNDDGIGIVLIQKLIEKKHGFSDDISFIDGGTGGMNLFHLLLKFDIVFIIDAVNFPGEFGDLRFFYPDDVVNLKNSKTYSAHEPDILQIIQLSKELEQDQPESLLIIGIKPKDIYYGTNLSDELSIQIPLYVDKIVNLINENIG